MNETSIATDVAFGRARDFDVTRKGDWVGVFEGAKNQLHVRFANSAGFPLALELRFPVVRVIAHDRVVVVDLRTTKGRANAHIFNRLGELLSSFCAGDGIEDVVVLGDLIAVTYFDEGVFGGVPPSEEGIAFFDFSGNLLWGYQSLMGSDAVDVADCYCATRVDHHTLAFSPYTDFPLVHVQPTTRQQNVHELPVSLRGATALSMHGATAFLYGPYEAKRTMFRWSPGTGAEGIGHHSGPLRGLEGGRFLSRGEHGFTVVDAVAD